ncbi:MAG TPA: histidine kinase, partial [Ferruginibacter sp.]|nr:histidine kinase [Ferruginibacter sp.]
MRKLILCIALSFCFESFISGQNITKRIIDSTKKELTTARGNKQIDCLNLLAEAYYDIWDEDDKQLDTACMYSEEAYKRAKKSGHKKGLGYSLLWKAHCYGGKVDDNRNNNNTEVNYAETYNYANKAIQIGEEIKDYRLAGDVYNMLKWLERWRGDQAKFKSNVEKAIYYYEKPVTGKINGHLNVSQCAQCQGNEGELGFLYILLSGFEDGSTPNREAYIQKAIYYYQKTNDHSSLGGAYMQLAESVTQGIDLEAGLDPFKKAIVQFHESGNAKGEFDAHMRICRNYWNLGDFENGFAYCKKGIVLAQELSKREKGTGYRLGEAYYWMSRYYLIAGDYESALYYIKKTEPFYQDEFRKDVWATAIGGVYRSMGNMDSAKYYLLPLGIKSPGSLGIQAANVEPSRLYIILKEYDKAVVSLNQLIKKNRERNYYISLGNELTVLSKAYLGKNENIAALNAAREGLYAIKRSKRNALLMENYETLSHIFYKLGNSDSAYIYLKLHMALKDSLLKRQYLFKLNNYKSEAENAKRTSQIMLLQKDYLIKEQELQQQIILKQKNDAQLSLLDQSNEIKDQQLLIKDQRLKEQTLLKEQNQSQLTLYDKENKLKDQRLRQQTLLRNALLGGLLLFILLGVFVFRTLSLKRKNEKLAIKKEQAELQQKVTELEMQALRAQMNPHFIFNCLSSINRFIFKNDN